MIPKFPLFKTLDLSLKDEIASYLAKFPSITCELCLANIYIWSKTNQVQLTLINDNLCLLVTCPDIPPFFIEPIGNNLLTKTIYDCLKYCGYMLHLSEDSLKNFTLSSNYQIVETPEYFEYVYATQELGIMKGTKFHGKRNHISQFKRLFPNFKYLPITKDFKDEALKIFSLWTHNATRTSLKKSSAFAQESAIANAFAYFNDFNFNGGYIEVDNKVLGFVLGSPLNQNTINLHFQYGVPGVHGIYPVLLQQFCLQAQKQFTYINLEQDLGVAGLRKMKLSYHPERIDKKYSIILK